MKKNILLLLLIFSVAQNLSAQVPKYVLFEHFTNTRCGSCGATNPSFYQRVNIDANPKLHHLSIHPSIPYSSCVFYQANPTPQNERANSFYGIFGTPSIAINGANVVSAGSVTATQIDNAYCLTCSPVEVRVTETSGSSRTASIRVRSVGASPSGSYKLYAAIVEKTVNYGAPNGESVHHNVFRQFLTASSGDAVSLAAQGGETALSFNYTVSGSWLAAETYVVAWLQNDATKEVVNSGTKFDAAIIPIELAEWSGKTVGSENELHWTTLTESNTDYFDIERGDDGKNFASIGRQKAAGNAAIVLHYSFTDKNAASSTPQYYRLKTVDLDGSSALSGVISLTKTGNKKESIVLFPNPVKDILNYKTNANSAETVEITLTDVLGRIVLTEKGRDTEGSLSVRQLARGTYIARLKIGDKQTFEKVIVE